MRTIYICTILIFTINVLHAQTVKGKIFGSIDAGKEILPGASVYWINSTSGVSANENAIFEISAANIISKRLVISYVGYISDTLDIADQTYITVTLKRSNQLKEVKVSGDRSGSYISTIDAIKTEVITQKELTKSACCDLSGCFETQSTVQPQTTNVITNSKELRILGLSGVYNQLLFDGLPLFQGLSFTYGISSLPGTLVDNIFIAKGANSVLQGYESISGQINVIPLQPDKTDKILLNAYVNSFMEKHFNANFATSLGKNKKWSTLLGLHTVQPANKFDRDNDKFLDLPLLTRYMAFNKWKYGNEAEAGLYSNIGLRCLNEKRIGGQTFFNANSDNENPNAYGQTVVINQPEIYAKTGFRFNSTHALVLQTSSFYQNQLSYFGTVKYKATQLNVYANMQHEWKWKEKHMLKYGASFRHQNLIENTSFASLLLPRTYAGVYNTKQNVPGFFAENTFSWNDDKFVLIVGARLDNHQEFGSKFTPRSMIKYKINETNVLRASVGTGWRQVNLFPENINLLVSSRDIVFAEKLNPEEALNWGVNYAYNFETKKISGTLIADFYQTYFYNQFFPDYDSDPTKAIVKNFTGKSISNGLQLEANLKFFKLIEFKTAYNFLDVFRIQNGSKTLLPFNAKNRVMAAVSYRPKNEKWYFDLNAHWYDKQRLPSTALNPIEYQYPDFSKRYTIVSGQVTYKIKQFEIYGGCENIFDFRQRQPIISWQNPFGQYFDTSSVWGPTRGRETYLGVRWRLKQVQ
jgi:outer membrane receptor for ferrienterochelin and colicins